jgi:lipopolysaccharide export system protein LptC
MKRRAYALFPIAILGLLAALTFWLQRAVHLESPLRKPADRHAVDFVVENFTLRKLDPAGKLLYQLGAERMVHYADEENTEVHRPDLTYLGNPPAMNLTARRATINKDRTVVDLREDVRAVREASGKEAELVITTSQLTVFPEQETATTPEPVRLTQGRSVLTGVGMDVDNKVRTFALRSQVKGTLYPR